MLNKPKVSIILTSYNHEEFIKSSIDSALNQTYSNFELIILDDHSTDNSWEIITGYKDNRIFAYRNEENQRIGNIRKAMDSFSNGEYLAILHSDDIWEPTKLQKQVEFLDKNPQVAATFTLVTIIDENNQPLTENDHLYSNIFDQPNRSRHEWLNYFFFHGNALCNPSSVRRKSIATNIKPIKGIYQLPDFLTWVQYCFQHEIHVIQEKLTRFRMRSDGSNWSGDKPDTRVRIQFELFKILSYFSKISSVEELLLIFPEAKDYINQEYYDILYALGMVSLSYGLNEPTKLFGLNLLFDALNDPYRSAKLEKYQNFDQNTFFKLTAKHDIFSYENLRRLNKQLFEKEQTVYQLRNALLFYETSKSWQLTKPLRDFMSKLRSLVKNL